MELVLRSDNLFLTSSIKPSVLILSFGIRPISEGYMPENREACDGTVHGAGVTALSNTTESAANLLIFGVLAL